MASSARPRRFWFDPRFAIGIVLVLVSVGGVLAIVSTADATTLAYAARGPLAPGDHIDEADLVAVDARIANVGELYLVPGDIPDEGLVITKSVGPGELVPASAAGSPSGLRFASIVVTVSGQLPASVEPGSTIDLWASSREDSSTFGPPSVIVAGAIVVRQVEQEGIVANGDASSLEVLVPRAKIARVLEAVANQDALSVVPTSIKAKG